MSIARFEAYAALQRPLTQPDVPVSTPTPASPSLDINDENVLSTSARNELVEAYDQYIAAQAKGTATPLQTQRLEHAYEQALLDEHGQIANKIVNKMGANNATAQNWYKQHPSAAPGIYSQYKSDLFNDFELTSDTFLNIKSDTFEQKVVPGLHQIFDKAITSLDSQIQNKVSINNVPQNEANRFKVLEDTTDQSAQDVYQAFSKLPNNVRKAYITDGVSLEKKFPNASSSARTTFKNYRTAIAKFHQAAEKESLAKLGLNQKGNTAVWMMENPESARKLSVQINDDISTRMSAIDNQNRSSGNEMNDFFLTSEITNHGVPGQYVAVYAGSVSEDERLSNRAISNSEKEGTTTYRQFDIRKQGTQYVIWDKSNKQIISDTEMNAMKTRDPELHDKLQSNLYSINSTQKDIDDAAFYGFIDKNAQQVKLKQLLASSQVVVHSPTLRGK